MEPGATGHETQEWDDEVIAEYYDDLTGVRLDPPPWLYLEGLHPE